MTLEFAIVKNGPFYVGSTSPRGMEIHIQEFDLAYSYEICLNPITVQDYEPFREIGYTNEKYWSEAGKRWKSRVNIDDLPRNWANQSHVKYSNHPINGLTFFEAVAFSRWYTDIRSDSLLYRLPTETEWEKAARGGLVIDGKRNNFATRIWPWGNDWFTERCFANTIEFNKRQTIAVSDHPPESKSPYGVVGMAGNLQEWCLNSRNNYPSNKLEQEEGNIRRMARGGSFRDDKRSAHCSYRSEFVPETNSGITLRLVRIKKEGK